MSDYIRLLVTIAKKEMSDDLNAARAENDLSDDVVSSIMKTAYATYDDTGDF